MSLCICAVLCTIVVDFIPLFHFIMIYLKAKEFDGKVVFVSSFQNSQQGSKFVKTGLDDLGKMSSSSVAPKTKVQPGSNGMLPQDSRHMPSRLSVSTSMPPPSSKSMSLPSSKNMPPPPSSSMPPPPPKFPSNEVLSRNENRPSALKEPMVPLRSLDASSVSPPKFWSAQLPLKDPREEKPSCASVSDTLLKLMDYGDDDDDDDIDEKGSVPRGDPTPSSGQKPFWAI